MCNSFSFPFLHYTLVIHNTLIKCLELHLKIDILAHIRVRSNMYDCWCHLNDWARTLRLMFLIYCKVFSCKFSVSAIKRPKAVLFAINIGFSNIFLIQAGLADKNQYKLQIINMFTLLAKKEFKIEGRTLCTYNCCNHKLIWKNYIYI